MHYITSQDSAGVDSHYNEATSDQESLGIQGFLLIFCVFELFIALFCPIFKTNIKGISELNLVIYILFILSAINLAILRTKLCIHNHDYIIFIYLIYCFFSVIYSCFSNEYNFKKELVELKSWMNPIVIYFLVKNSIRNVKQVIALRYSLTIILVLSSTISIIGYFLLPDIFVGHEGRAVGIVKQHNLFGMFIITLSPLLFLSFDQRKKIIKFISIAVVMIALIQTGSRGAFLGQFIVLILILNKIRHKIKAGTVGMFVILGFLTFLSLSYFQGQNVFNRFQKSDDQDLMEYSSGRLGVWPMMLKEYAKKPILGYGFNSFNRKFSLKYMGKSFAAHNEYINILFTLGIIGFFLFVLIYYNIWKILRKNKHLLLASACRYSMIGFCIHITFSEPNQTRYFFWLLVAITLRFIDLNEERKQRA